MLQRNLLSLLAVGLLLSVAIAVDTAEASGPPSQTATSGAPKSDMAKSAAEKLYVEHKCYECHRPVEHHIGPSFQAISLRYAPEDDRAALIKRLAAKIIQGGYGNWGIVPMNSNPNVTPEEAAELTKWILSQP
ncbi:MAG: c-type cytochrome [Gammaproteobacteria bacterium]|nr:c-type cytochrome [Gammaproteobacteria bacterium]